MFSVLGKAIYSPSTNTSALLPLKVPNCGFLLPFHFRRARWMLFFGGDRTWIPPAAGNSLSAGPESPASAAQLHRRHLHPLLQLHHRPPLFTSTCIHEDKLPGDHSGLLQFRRFFCRDEATVELVAQAEGGRVTYCAYSFCSTIQWTNAEHTFCRHAIHATS